MQSILPFFGCVMLIALGQEALELFGLSWVDAVAVTLLYIVAPLLVMDRLESPDFKRWQADESNLGTLAAMMFGLPLLVAIVLWYADGPHGIRGRTDGFIAFFVYYYIAIPFGGALVLYADKKLQLWSPQIRVPVRPQQAVPAPVSSPLPEIDGAAFAFDPARFGRESTAPQPSRPDLSPPSLKGCGPSTYIFRLENGTVWRADDDDDLKQIPAKPVNGFAQIKKGTFMPIPNDEIEGLWNWVNYSGTIPN